jgi:hypothetical protein
LQPERLVVPGLKNRPLEPCAGDVAGGVDGKRKDGVIEGAAKVVDKITGQYGRPVAGILHLHADNMPAAIGIVRPRDDVGLRIVEDLQLGLEGFEMLKRPGGLQLRVSQALHGKILALGAGQSIRCAPSPGLHTVSLCAVQILLARPEADRGAVGALFSDRDGIVPEELRRAFALVSALK